MTHLPPCRDCEKAAKELAKIAAKGIVQLGFKKADFQVRIVALPPSLASRYSATNWCILFA